MIEKAVQGKSHVVVIGDFNCKMLKPDSGAVKLAAIMSEYGLVQMVTDPTRVTQSSQTQIDLLFTTKAGLFESVDCEEPGLSDHSLNVGKLVEKVDRKREVLRMVRGIGRCSIEDLVADLSSTPWHVMDSLDDMDSKWDFWKKLFSEIVDTHIRLKKARVRRKSLSVDHTGSSCDDEGKELFLHQGRGPGAV